MQYSQLNSRPFIDGIINEISSVEMRKEAAFGAGAISKGYKAAKTFGGNMHIRATGRAFGQNKAAKNLANLTDGSKGMSKAQSAETRMAKKSLTPSERKAGTHLTPAKDANQLHRAQVSDATNVSRAHTKRVDDYNFSRTSEGKRISRENKSIKKNNARASSEQKTQDRLTAKYNNDERARNITAEHDKKVADIQAKGESARAPKDSKDLKDSKGPKKSKDSNEKNDNDTMVGKAQSWVKDNPKSSVGAGVAVGVGGGVVAASSMKKKEQPGMQRNPYSTF